MRTLRDRAVHVLVDRLLEEEDFDPDILSEPGRIADFWELVRECLQTRSIESGNTLSFARLLASAYAGSSHLDLVRFSTLPPEGLFLALRTEELAGVKSISLCVDRISGSVDLFVSELSRLPRLEELYFMSDPRRETDQCSSRLFVRLAREPQLLNKQLFLSGAFSASLAKNIWLPTVDYEHPYHSFPIQHLLVSHHETPRSDDEQTKYSPSMYYFGDSLLRAEHFAAGFLLYLQCLYREDDPSYSMAAAPRTLAELDLDLGRAALGPMPAENRAIQLRPPLHTVDEGDNSPAGYVAVCRPKPRPLAPGSWTVLVSHETYIDREIEEQNRRTWRMDPTKVPIIKYAFVRVRGCSVSASGSGPPAGYQVDYVGGLQEFLALTAPLVDTALVGRRLDELEARLGCLPLAARPPAGVKQLRVLGREEAFELLDGFMLHAVLVKRSLCAAMREDAEPGMFWLDRTFGFSTFKDNYLVWIVLIAEY